MRDSQAGCHRPDDVAETFEKLDALAASGALTRERGPARPRDDRSRDGVGGMSREQLAFVASDGGRWVAASDAATAEITRLLGRLPEENQSEAQPPARPAGDGPQLMVLSASASPAGGEHRMLQAALSADGRWWCFRSVGARPADKTRLRGKRPPPLGAADAGAVLGRVLAGAHPRKAARDADSAASADSGVSVEVAFSGAARAPLRPSKLAKTVLDRFAAEMRGQSPACASP